MSKVLIFKPQVGKMFLGQTTSLQSVIPTFVIYIYIYIYIKFSRDKGPKNICWALGLAKEAQWSEDRSTVRKM